MVDSKQVKRVLMSWSSSKDSAWALHVLRQDPSVKVVALLTTYNSNYDRVAMHGVRLDLLRMQAKSSSLPIIEAPLPWPCPNGEYERQMELALQRAKDEYGITDVAFGDLYLEDVRKYREEKMAGTGLGLLFPLWGSNTKDLSRQMVDAGVKARITCLDPAKLDRRLAGALYTHEFLDQLGEGIDPCAENGEFHSFAFDGPMFRIPVEHRVGETVEREGFVFTDLIPLT